MSLSRNSGRGGSVGGAYMPPQILVTSPHPSLPPMPGLLSYPKWPAIGRRKGLKWHFGRPLAEADRAKSVLKMAFAYRGPAKRGGVPHFRTPLCGAYTTYTWHEANSIYESFGPSTHPPTHARNEALVTFARKRAFGHFLANRDFHPPMRSAVRVRRCGPPSVLTGELRFILYLFATQHMRQP